MKRYYFDGNYMWDMGDNSGTSIHFRHLYDGSFWNFCFVISLIFNFAIRFAAGFGIGLLIKAVWHAIFG